MKGRGEGGKGDVSRGRSEGEVSESGGGGTIPEITQLFRQ